MIITMEEWNKSVDHPLQSWEWGEFRKQRQPISRVGGMLIVWTKIKFTPWYFGYVPMGKWPSEDDLGELRREGKKMGAIGIRLEPNIEREKAGKLNLFRPGRNLFKPKTYLIDLTKSEEELLKKMHPKGRYNIKVAQKHGVKIEESNQETHDFETYLDLMFGGTAKRQKVYFHGRQYQTQLWKSLGTAGVARLFTAKLEGRMLAAAQVFLFRERMYYAYGATALEHKEVMAPTLLLWEIMRWGKSHNYKVFDLWGAEEGRGFSRFKEQFGGEIVETAGTFDLPINGQLYPLFRLVEEIRWKILH